MAAAPAKQAHGTESAVSDESAKVAEMDVHRGIGRTSS
jgi:hypothetical protein